MRVGSDRVCVRVCRRASLAGRGTAVLEYYTLYARTFLAARLATPGAHAADPIVFSLVGIWRAVSGIAWPVDAAIAAAIVAGALMALDRGEGQRQLRSAALMVCLYLAASLLITPMSETHHLAYVLPGLTLLTWRAADAPVRESLVSLGAVYLALLMTRSVPIAAFGGGGRCVRAARGRPASRAEPASAGAAWRRAGLGEGGGGGEREEGEGGRRGQGGGGGGGRLKPAGRECRSPRAGVPQSIDCSREARDRDPAGIGSQ